MSLLFFTLRLKLYHVSKRGPGINASVTVNQFWFSYSNINHHCESMPALVEIIAWHQRGAKPLTEPMLTSTPTRFHNAHFVTSFYMTIHYNDVIMGAIASLITSLTIVYSTVYSDADQRKHQSSASLAFVWGIHRGKCFHLMTSSWSPPQ